MTFKKKTCILHFLRDLLINPFDNFFGKPIRAFWSFAFLVSICLTKIEQVIGVFYVYLKHEYEQILFFLFLIFSGTYKSIPFWSFAYFIRSKSHYNINREEKFEIIVTFDLSIIYTNVLFGKRLWHFFSLTNILFLSSVVAF